MNEFDTKNLNEILYGEDNLTRFSWANAHILRFLNIIMAKTDLELQAQLYHIWPEQLTAIYIYWGWSEESITARINLLKNIYRVQMLKENQ